MKGFGYWKTMVRQRCRRVSLRRRLRKRKRTPRANAQRLRRRYPKGGGNPVIADRGCVRPPIRKGKGQRSIKSEANTVPVRVGVG